MVGDWAFKMDWTHPETIEALRDTRHSRQMQLYNCRTKLLSPVNFFHFGFILSTLREDEETLVLTSSVRVLDCLKEVVTIIYCGGQISSLIHWHGLVWEPLGIMIDSDNAVCPVSIGPGLSIAGFQKWQDFPWQVARAGSSDHCLADTGHMVSPRPAPPRSDHRLREFAGKLVHQCMTIPAGPTRGRCHIVRANQSAGLVACARNTECA